ncbi:zinc finger CCCH domain-containing protein 55-like [Hibiscus syriacus]|uniref:zinc finger CCCH domain-containing protein 55-like n=1 Tax=Hibiscus syriacus TaxID=106335 RepID=UPI0019212ED7|nr:zinc finger CCCH domain-containing protein 55-like [Hibiscus syriacus]
MTLGFQHKLDKFGRLVRDGASDSDSDDSCYIGRYISGGPRSRNQSHSPLDRRRSPQRRRKKHSLSRSWSPRNRRSRSKSPRNRRSRSRSPRNRRCRSRSPRNRRSRSRSPRNRRSRSRSPSFKHTKEFRGENKRRVKGQMPFCFDFLRGKCYRGVSCRYLHHDSGKSYESRWQRSKLQLLELPHASRTNNAREEIKQSSEKREDSGDESNEYHMVKSDRSRDIPASSFETHLLENKQETRNPVSYENCQEAAAESQHLSTIDSSSVGNMGSLESCGNASREVLTSFSSPLEPVCQNASCQPQQSDNSTMSDSLPCKPSTSPLNRLPESNIHPHAMELRNHPCHISSPSVLCSHGKDNPHMKEQQISSSMFQSSGESFPSNMLPIQESYFAPPLISLPPASVPPLPPPLDSTVTPSVHSHFRQSYFPLRNDFGSQIIPRPYLTELHACSQADGLQQRAYPPIQDVNQPILQASLPICNLPGAPSMLRDDGSTQTPMRNIIASNSFSQGNTHPYTLPCSQQLMGSKMQPFPSESLPPGGLSYSSSYIYPYAQQQPPHSSDHPMIDSIYNLGGKTNSSMTVPPNIGDTSSHRVDIGGSSSSIHNPNVSTLVQPLNIKHSSGILWQEKDVAYNRIPFSLAHHPVRGRGIGSQQTTLSPNSSRNFGQNFLRTDGDQYDPLFDSIEPSSSLSGKNNCIQKLEVTGDSDILLGLSGSNEPLNMGESQRKDAAAAASVDSSGNKEFGETADGKVSAVESGSPSNPDEVIMATSEVEIDQIKSPGKSKDSKSMKHFKVALAHFVKELLKPSWQQGNMSKEAFKTIVKKTVDKVSGAMKSHHIPKSSAKIDRYIELSQQKLTKLVTGYVDKYVNV